MRFQRSSRYYAVLSAALVLAGCGASIPMPSPERSETLVFSCVPEGGRQRKAFVYRDENGKNRIDGYADHGAEISNWSKDNVAVERTSEEAMRIARTYCANGTFDNDIK